jgi:hypothetical protein
VISTNQAEIYNQEWCKDLIRRLGRKKELEARSEILDAIIAKRGGPSSKVVASYGDTTKGTGKTDDEVEFDTINFELKVLNAALNSLDRMDKLIIVLKYVEKGINDWHVIELEIPKYFFDHRGRPLYIAERTMRDKKRKALIKMGKLLGYSVNCRLSATQGAMPMLD